MVRLSLQIISLATVFSCLPTGLAGPACARKNYQQADCITKCRTRFGWSNYMMGTDPWGNVLAKTEDPDAILAKACGSALPQSSGSNTALPIKTVTPPAQVGQQSSSTSSTSTSTSVTTTGTSTTSNSTSTTTTLSTPSVQNLAAGTTTTQVTPTTIEPAVTNHQPTTTKAAATSSPAAPRPATTQKNTSSQAAPTTGTGTGSGTSDSDIQAYLSAHNTVRAQHGASPLTWNAQLASKAQQWANNCKTVHSGGSLGPYGENLAWGAGNGYGIAKAIASWADEVSNYSPSNPDGALHYTQMVWKGTTELGCAVATCSNLFPGFSDAKFFVCEYSAQGNIIGAFAQNVQ